MIDIHKPLELDDGSLVEYVMHTPSRVHVELPNGIRRWYNRESGQDYSVTKGAKLRNVAAPASGKTEDQEFWERAYLAALSNSAQEFAPETTADDALRYRNKRWTS